MSQTGGLRVINCSPWGRKCWIWAQGRGTGAACRGSAPWGGEMGRSQKTSGYCSGTRGCSFQERHYGIQVPDMCFGGAAWSTSWEPFSFPPYIGSVCMRRKVWVQSHRICQAKIHIFLASIHFLRQNAFFPILCLESAKTSSDTGRFRSTVQDHCWFLRLSGMGYRMSSSGEEQSYLLWAPYSTGFAGNHLLDVHCSLPSEAKSWDAQDVYSLIHFLWKYFSLRPMSQIWLVLVDPRN